MMYRIWIILLFVAAAQCHNVRRRQAPNPYSELSESVMNFALSFGDLSAGQNYVFSPVSITSVLSMLLLGADRRTYHELQAALQYPSTVNVTIFHEQYRQLIDSLNKPTNDVELSIANRLFIHNSYSLKPRYVMKSQRFYHAPAEILDFQGDSINAMNTINSWVASKTDDQIKQILSSPPGSSTKMIVANAVYFHGFWENMFHQEDTRLLDFTSDPGRTVKIPIMKNILSIPHHSSTQLGCSIVGVPYRGRSWFMYFIMANGDGRQALVDVEKRLNAATLNGLLDNMRNATVSLGIPRMRANMRIKLNEPLSNLGIADLFNPGSADLSGISDSRDGDLFISDFVHQALIDVNERGTEASAASVATMSRDKPTVTFHATKPFLAIIMDSRDRVPLFWLRMTDPRPSRRNS